MHRFIPPAPGSLSDARHSVSCSAQSLWIYFILQVVIGIGTGLLVAMLPIFLTRVLANFISNGTFIWFWEHMETIKAFAKALIGLLGTVIPALAVCVFLRHQLHIAAWQTLKNPTFELKDVFKGLGLIYCGTMAWSLLTLALESLLPVTITQPELLSGQNPGVLFLDFLTIVLIGPLCEELVFRGGIMRSLQKFNPLFALVFSALAFAMLHLNFAQGVPAFFMGLVFGWYALKTGSLRTSFVLHMFNNLIAYIAMLIVPGSIPEMILGFVSLALAIAGLVVLVRSRKQIGAYIQKYQFEDFFKLLFSSVWMIAFAVVFVGISIFMLFM